MSPPRAPVPKIGDAPVEDAVDFDIRGSGTLEKLAQEQSNVAKHTPDDLELPSFNVQISADLFDEEADAVDLGESIAAAIDGPSTVGNASQDVQLIQNMSTASSEPKRTQVGRFSYKVCQMDAANTIVHSSSLNHNPHSGIVLVVLLLSTCFPIGFLGGCVGVNYVRIFVFYVPITMAGPWAVSFAHGLMAWSIGVWCCWAFLVAAPLNVAIQLATGSNKDLQLIYLLVLVGISGTTMPVPLAAARFYDYERCFWKEILKMIVILISMLVACMFIATACVVDKVVLTTSDSAVVKAFRPLIVFVLRKCAYAGYCQSMSYHPSKSFRSVYLFFIHMTLGTLTASGASNCGSWGQLLFFLGLDIVLDTTSVLFYAVGGTALLKGSKLIWASKWLWDVGKAVPYQGVVKLEYRGLELNVCSLSISSLLAGMLLSYVCVLRWIELEGHLQHPIRFWFPKGDTSALFLVIFLVREVIYDYIVHTVVRRKTGLHFRTIISFWLSSSSPIGWRVIFCAAGAASFLVDFLTYLSYDLEELAESYQKAIGN